MPEDVGRIFNIQKFSLHDGPGIRTVVFLKGCPLACSWCSNPGSRKLQVLRMKDPDHEDVYVADSREYAVEEAVRICMQDMAFYEESGGGVTLSGGEAMVQHAFGLNLLRKLRKRGVHTAVETTGYAAPAIFKKFLAQLDLVIMDVKHHDRAEHKKWTAMPNDLPLQNLRTAVKSGKPLWVRIPVVPGVNDTLEDAAAFSKLLQEYGVDDVQLLPFHQFGERKYELLDWTYKMSGVPALHREDLTDYREVFLENGIEAHFDSKTA